MQNKKQDAAVSAATEAAEWHAGREGLAVTFERIVVGGDAAVASFLVDTNRRMVVGLQCVHGDWDTLHSRVLSPQYRAFQSLRPSEHRGGQWAIVVCGLAPDGASSASIALAGDQHVVPVIEGLYLFAATVDREPGLERLPVSFVE